jgi:hypothetical protein
MQTSTRPADADSAFLGAEIVFGNTVIGRVEGVQRDPVSHRVRRLITRYGPHGRWVAVPMEWVVRSSAGRIVLGVGADSFDDLADQTPEQRV